MRIPSIRKITKSFVFRRLIVKATGIIGKPYLLYNVAKESLEKSGKDASLKGMAEEGIASVGRLIRLVKSYAAGDYRDVSRKNIILVVAGLLYFVSPLDLIPDALPIVGYLDDVTIIGFVLSTLGAELLKFEAYEEKDHTIGGSPTEPSGTSFASGAHADLTDRGITSADSVSTPLDA